MVEIPTAKGTFKFYSNPFAFHSKPDSILVSSQSLLRLPQEQVPSKAKILPKDNEEDKTTAFEGNLCASASFRNGGKIEFVVRIVMSLLSSLVSKEAELHSATEVFNSLHLFDRELQILGSKMCLLKETELTGLPWWPRARICAWVVVTAYGSVTAALEGIQSWDDYMHKVQREREVSGTGILSGGVLGTAALFTSFSMKN